MPCDSSHCEPTRRERESTKVIDLLREVGLLISCEYNSQYGNVLQLDEHTRQLCEWCKAHDVTKQSLELQIWWRDHQKADAAKAKYQAELIEVHRIREAALAKLTKQERKALGLR